MSIATGTVQTSAHPDPLTTAALQTASQLRRDIRLFLTTVLAAHAAVIVNLVAVLQ